MTFLHGLSLISDRQQLVDVAGTHSTTALSTYGVPLMFILGPLLCLIYVNDMSANLSNKLLLYAQAQVSDLGRKNMTRLKNKPVFILKSVKKNKQTM
jgi:hypothetical protein